MADKVYFGHPINTYHTDLETMLITAIKGQFKDFDIVNPAARHHRRAYAARRKETGNGMNYFIDEVLPFCDIGVFLPFQNNLFGAGVYMEAAILHQQGKPIYEVMYNGFVLPLPFPCVERSMTVPETKMQLALEKYTKRRRKR